MALDELCFVQFVHSGGGSNRNRSRELIRKSKSEKSCLHFELLSHVALGKLFTQALL